MYVCIRTYFATYSYVCIYIIYMYIEHIHVFTYIYIYKCISVIHTPQLFTCMHTFIFTN